MNVFKDVISGKDVMKQVRFAGGQKNKSQIRALVVNWKGLIQHYLVLGISRMVFLF